MMLKLYWGAAVLWLLAALVACGGGEQEVSDQEVSDQEVSDEIIAINGVQLYNAYQASVIAADEKYTGRVLLVTGVVNKIGTDATTDTPYIEMSKAFIGYGGIKCRFAEKEVPGLADVAKVQTITVKGKNEGLLGVNVELSGCTLQ